MKAIQITAYGGPEVMRLVDIDTPVVGPGQVRVGIRAIGVNPVDTYMRAGQQGYTPSLPFTPGLDAAGVVEAVGEGVETVAAGQRVYTSGSLGGVYAEQALCEVSQVHELPDNVSFEEGAAVNVPYATAYRALFQRGRGRAGERVLVHGGSGAVGLAAIQMAVAAGLHVIATAGSEQGRELVAGQGAMVVLDHHDPDHLRQLLKLSDGQGVDMVIEMLADRNLDADLAVLAAGGRVVVVGSRGPVEINPRELMRRDAAILGMSLMNLGSAEKHAIHAALIAGLKRGVLQPVIREVLPLSEAARAHERVMEAGARGKILLRP